MCCARQFFFVFLIYKYISDLSFLFACYFSCIQGNGCLHCKHTYFYIEVLAVLLYMWKEYFLISSLSLLWCYDTIVMFLTREFPSVGLLLQTVFYRTMSILRGMVFISCSSWNLLLYFQVKNTKSISPLTMALTNNFHLTSSELPLIFV